MNIKKHLRAGVIHGNNGITAPRPNFSADDGEPKNGALVESRALFIPTSIHF